MPDHDQPAEIPGAPMTFEAYARIREQMQAAQAGMQQAQHAYRNYLLYGQGEWQVIPPLDPELAQQRQPIPTPVPEPPKENPEMKLLNPFLIGCDPEFVCLDKSGKHMNMKASFAHEGPVGYDHEGDVLEVRPLPARSVSTLLKHIRDTIKLAKFPGKLRAGAVFNTGKRIIGLGGHVHLDVSYRNSLLHRQITALDAFTDILVKRDILPKIESTTRREQTPYGRPSDTRQANQADRLEYRTMASWLFSPITSYVCLTGAKLAVAQPEAVLQALTSPKAKLTKMFSRFASEDWDAARVSELILENGVKLQRDPDMNVLTVWAAESQELKTLEIE